MVFGKERDRLKRREWEKKEEKRNKKKNNNKWVGQGSETGEMRKYQE